MEVLKTIRPELLSLTQNQIQALNPYFWVFGGVILTVLASVFRMIRPKWLVFFLTVGTCIAGVILSFGLLGGETVPLFNSMMISDNYSNFFNIVFLVAAGLTALTSFRYLDKEDLQYSEYYVLLLLSTLGMMLMASTLDLIVIFIALELMSLPIYILVGFRRFDRRSNEASMKYFILGAAASAVLLYGAALLYGTTGLTGVKAILGFVQTHPDAASPVFVLGAGLVLAGFLFKVASVPFHMWMPDVYEGAPTPITGFMTSGLKAAAFASLIRIFISMGMGGYSEAGVLKTASVVLTTHIHDLLWLCAVLTMVIGNIIALTQTQMKRMLAYSSIAHTGYLLIGLIAGPRSELGLAPAVLYVVVYAIMNLGAFAILTVLSERKDAGLNLHDLSGISRKHPWLSFAMAVFLLSMAGIPPTAGFAAKYMLFYSAIQANEVGLVVIAVLCSAVSVYYYLRVLVYMYMRDPSEVTPTIRVSVWSTVAVVAMVGLTLQIGVLPSQMMQLAKKAVMSL